MYLKMQNKESIYDKIEYNDLHEVIMDGIKFNIQTRILENEQQHFWTRLYLKEEIDLPQGCIVEYSYAPTGEKIEMVFTNYDKKNQTDKHFEDLIEYVKEDDKKVLCLLVDMKEINTRQDIPTLRRMFKHSIYFEQMFLRIVDLPFTIITTNEEGTEVRINLEYYDVEY